MDKLILALAPGFVAGFAVQRVLEIFGALVDWIAGRIKDKTASPEEFKVAKAATSAVISIILGVLIAYATDIRVLAPLGSTGPDWVDIAVTALVISAGTEGMNSILKWLGYKKDAAEKNAAG